MPGLLGTCTASVPNNLTDGAAWRRTHRLTQKCENIQRMPDSSPKKAGKAKTKLDILKISEHFFFSFFFFSLFFFFFFKLYPPFSI